MEMPFDSTKNTGGVPDIWHQLRRPRVSAKILSFIPASCEKSIVRAWIGGEVAAFALNIDI